MLRDFGRTLSAGRLVELRNLEGQTRGSLARFHERYDLLMTATIARAPARIGELLATPVEKFGMRVLQWLPVHALLRQALVAGRKQLLAYPNTQIFNITGQPGISLPVQRDRAGLPIGVQLVARLGDEATLLRVASQLETELRWDKERPPMLE